MSRKGIVLDRCIFDNLAKFFPASDRTLALATAFVRAALSRFDLRIHLTATAAELLSRRSESTPEEVDRLVSNYRSINARAEAVVVPSDDDTLRTTVKHILALLGR